jgi:hypothetical protein
MCHDRGTCIGSGKRCLFVMIPLRQTFSDRIPQQHSRSLTGRLAPDFKTIADFRKDIGSAIRATCRHFIMLCRQLDLFTRAIVAINGSRFKAVNTRDKNFTHASIQRRRSRSKPSLIANDCESLTIRPFSQSLNSGAKCNTPAL